MPSCKVTAQWVGSPYFVPAEFECRCGCKGMPKNELIRKMVQLRAAIGRPIVITSGYRCPNYNAHVSNSGEDGPHTRGLAADVRTRGPAALELIKEAINLGFTGFGIAQKGARRYVHLDLVQPGDEQILRPMIWSY